MYPFSEECRDVEMSSLKTHTATPRNDPSDSGTEIGLVEYFQGTSSVTGVN